MKEFARLLQGNIVKGLETIHIGKDGREIHLVFNAKFIVDDKGNPAGTRGTAYDITERKRAEEEVRRRAEQPAALNALGRQVSATLSLEETCTAAVRGMLDTAHPDLAFLFLREGEKLMLKGIGPKKVGKRLGEIPEHRVGECMCGLAVTEGKPLYSRDIFADARCTWEECKKAGFRSFAALPLRGGDEIIGVIGLAADTERDFETQAEFLETLANQVAIALDNARLDEAARRRLKELTVLYDASQRLQKLLSPDQLAQEIIEILEKNLNYTYGAVLLVDEEGTLAPFALSDQKRGAEFLAGDKEYIRSKIVRVGAGITGWVAQHGESARVDNVLADPRYLSMREDVRSELCVPLRIQSLVIGVVNIESTEIGAYSENDQRLLETISAQIAVALQNARLLEETRLGRDRLAELSRQLAETHEREARAIGRELHDQVGQILTAMKITLDVAGQLPPEAAAKKIAQAQELTGDLLNRVSRLSLQLRPPMLDDLGLVPALVWHINHFQEETNIAMEFKHSGVEGRRFAAEIETTAYRIVQESLTNAARHARATRVDLNLQQRSEWLDIEIEDNGIGFDPQPAFEKHRGLSGMRERVRLLGGEFTVQSAAGQGTRLEAKIPLRGGGGKRRRR